MRHSLAANCQLPGTLSSAGTALTKQSSHSPSRSKSRLKTTTIPPPESTPQRRIWKMPNNIAIYRWRDHIKYRRHYKDWRDAIDPVATHRYLKRLPLDNVNGYYEIIFKTLYALGVPAKQNWPGLGDLSIFPNELLIIILQNLDIPTLIKFRLVNHAAMNTTNAVPSDMFLVNNFPEAIRAFILADASNFSCEDLSRSLAAGNWPDFPCSGHAKPEDDIYDEEDDDDYYLYDTDDDIDIDFLALANLSPSPKKCSSSPFSSHNPLIRDFLIPAGISKKEIHLALQTLPKARALTMPGNSRHQIEYEDDRAYSSYRRRALFYDLKTVEAKYGPGKPIRSEWSVWGAKHAHFLGYQDVPWFGNEDRKKFLAVGLGNMGRGRGHPHGCAPGLKRVRKSWKNDFEGSLSVQELRERFANRKCQKLVWYDGTSLGVLFGLQMLLWVVIASADHSSKSSEGANFRGTNIGLMI
ncbi:hypothetical protein QBC35DRAFT_467125 [Podospora australis]|uniref:F-box domain-containing protein n=1 Tax=Podospora australis TaxID=1536484 RepID=A0AAN6WLT3_9PEZI|nr:hypothetical protein QBC35DRAFT_467125 [Podospora australis]